MASSKEEIRTAMTEIMQARVSAEWRIKAAQVLMELDQGETGEIADRVNALEKLLVHFPQAGEVSLSDFLNGLTERVEMLERRVSKIEG